MVGVSRRRRDRCGQAQGMTALRAQDDGMGGDEGGYSGRGEVSESAGASAWAGARTSAVLRAQGHLTPDRAE